MGTGIVQNLVEDPVSVEDKGRRINVSVAEIRSHSRNIGVVGRDITRFQLLRRTALRGGERGTIDGRHVEEEEVARAALVKHIHQAGVLCDILCEDGGRVSVAVGVANVVDAKEAGEKGVLPFPVEKRGTGAVTYLTA
jgi:hypothetical protein